MSLQLAIGLNMMYRYSYWCKWIWKDRPSWDALLSTKHEYSIESLVEMLLITISEPCHIFSHLQIHVKYIRHILYSSSITSQMIWIRFRTHNNLVFFLSELHVRLILRLILLPMLLPRMQFICILSTCLQTWNSLSLKTISCLLIKNIGDSNLWNLTFPHHTSSSDTDHIRYLLLFEIHPFPYSALWSRMSRRSLALRWEAHDQNNKDCRHADTLEVWSQYKDIV